MSAFIQHWPARYSFQLDREFSQDHLATSPTESIHSALWLESGSITKNGEVIAQGDGTTINFQDQLVNVGDNPATVLRFQVVNAQAYKDFTTTPIDIERSSFFNQSFSTSWQEAILRLDQVDFPAGAVAYKHTHSGTGIRHLVKGGLTIDGEHGIQQMLPRDSWFEDVNSPVIATAIDSEPSCFIRLMLLPLEFEGLSTFKLVNAEDKHKPALQKNCRHFEKRIVI